LHVGEKMIAVFAHYFKTPPSPFLTSARGCMIEIGLDGAAAKRHQLAAGSGYDPLPSDGRRAASFPCSGEIKGCRQPIFVHLT